VVTGFRISIINFCPKAVLLDVARAAAPLFFAATADGLADALSYHPSFSSQVVLIQLQSPNHHSSRQL
jgi:hypothetical protein